MQEVLEVETPQGKIGRPKGSRTAKAKIAQAKQARMIELKVSGCSVAEIAQATDVSESTVERTLRIFQPVFKKLSKVEEFRNVKAKIYDAAQLVALESLVKPSKMQKAGVRDLAIAVDILNKNSRLEEGKSTSNAAIGFPKLVLSGLIPPL